MQRTYAVVFEQGTNNYAAYAPDVPGCVATAEGWHEIQTMIREAIEVYLEAAAEYGEPLPEPRMSVAQAMAHHSDVLTRLGAHDAQLEATVAMLNVGAFDGPLKQGADAGNSLGCQR